MRNALRWLSGPTGEAISDCLRVMVVGLLATLAIVFASFAFGCGPTVAQTRTRHAEATDRCVANESAIVARCQAEGTSREACSALVVTERSRCATELRTICRANLRAREVCHAAE